MDIGNAFESGITWLTENGAPFFDGVSTVLGAVVAGLEAGLLAVPAWAMIAGLTAAVWRTASGRTAVFAAAGLSLIAYHMDLWAETMETLALVLTATTLALLLGMPLGVAAAKRDWVDRALRPVLDFMQTMPAFVYLIPAVLLFRLGAVPGVLATVIFAMPPAVRLTNLGLRRVPTEAREAAQAFGATPAQQLWKVELPIALPTLMAGVNQTIMLALSMVVIAALIGAGGLGKPVLQGITQLQIGLGFESGLAVVILAIVLDRLTQGVGKDESREA